MTEFFDHEDDEVDDNVDELDEEYYEDDDSLDAEAAIQRAIAELERAKQLPLSSSVMVQRADLLELLHQALDSLPIELQEAQLLLRNREAFIEGQERDGKRILEDVRVQAEQMMAKTEIVRQSQRMAEEIVEAANEQARQLRFEADSFVERKLTEMEIVVQRILKTVLSGREKLAPVVEAGQAPLVSDDFDPDDDAGGFFDQELQ